MSDCLDLLSQIRDPRSIRRRNRNFKKRWNFKESVIRNQHIEYRNRQRAKADEAKKSSKQIKREQDEFQAIQDAYKAKIALRDLENLKKKLAIEGRDNSQLRKINIIETLAIRKEELQKKYMKYLISAY
ncbi:unnamed protein product [Blepharisma stoltei]|uniref:Uncharacterized protein n=1 Tax=Blepharisma stoltei TaxID=1481888 RepID=A0AAU9J4N5_9CILI|nr:unnamed protein product [Blepharisma stoltei]